MALTILLRTNRGRTQRALKTEVRMNSNQDHTLPWREGSPGAKEDSLLTDRFVKPVNLPRNNKWPYVPMIFAVRVCSSGINTR